MFFQQFSGINAIVTNLNELFHESHIEIPLGIASGISAMAQVIAVLIGTVIIYKLGRRLVWIISLFGAALFMFFYALTKKINSIPSYISIIIIFCYLLSFGIGLGPIPWYIIPEIFPSSVVSQAVSFCTIFNWLSSFTVYLERLKFQLPHYLKNTITGCLNCISPQFLHIFSRNHAIFSTEDT